MSSDERIFWFRTVGWNAFSLMLKRILSRSDAWCDDGSGFFSLRVMPFRKRIGGLDAFIHPAQAFEDYGSPRLVDRVFGGFKSGTEGE